MSRNPFGIERLGGFTSHAIKKAREARHSGPFKELCKMYEKREEFPLSQSEILEEANPDGFYQVGGEIVRGSEFPEGILPANAVRIPEEDISQETNSS
jgi:hypothetical protein